MYTLAVFNLKGGVGKTTTAVNLAYEAASQGYKTILWDLDPQGASTWYLKDDTDKLRTKRMIKGRQPIGDFIRSSKYKNLSLLPASVSQRHADIHLHEGKQDGWNLKNIVSALSETYELLVIDCPPSFSILAEQVINASEIVICPTIPSPLSINTIESMLQLFKKNNLDRKKLHILFSLVDIRRKSQKNILLNPPVDLPGILKHYIPYNTLLEKMATHRSPLKVYSPQSTINLSYENILDEVINSMQKDRPDLYHFQAAELATHLH